MKGHWRGEVGEIAFPATNRNSARGQRRERISGCRSRLQDGYRLSPLGDLEALPASDPTQVDTEVLAQLADPDSLHDAQM